MNSLGAETLAIVRATIDEVDARHSALMLATWHHAGRDQSRELVMADFFAGTEAGSLAQVFVRAARARLDGRWPPLRPPAGFVREGTGLLERAFAGALADVLGPLGRPLVINAWAEMLRAFLHELARRLPPPHAA